MWSWLSAPRIAGIITAIGPPKLGINWSKPARIAHTSAHGIPMIHSPTNQRIATASESWHWAMNQFLSAVPVVWAWERQFCQSISFIQPQRTQRSTEEDQSYWFSDVSASDNFT